MTVHKSVPSAVRYRERNQLSHEATQPLDRGFEKGRRSHFTLRGWKNPSSDVWAADGRENEPVMTVMIDLAVVWLVGVLAAIPAVIWLTRDLSRIHSPTWYWKGHHRQPWQWAVLIGWLAGGWPAMVIVLVWSQSALRRDLLSHDPSDVDHPRRRATDPQPHRD